MGYFAVYYIVVKMLSCSLLMLFPGNFALFLVAFVLFAKKKKKKKSSQNIKYHEYTQNVQIKFLTG